MIFAAQHLSTAHHNLLTRPACKSVLAQETYISTEWDGGSSRSPAHYPLYLGKVFGNATTTVGIRDFCVLQVHNSLAHILVQQDSTVMAPWERGGNR